MDWLKKQITDQSTHTGVLLLAILYVGAKAAGLDVLGMGQELAKLVVLLGTISGGAKILLPGGVTVPPQVAKAAEALPGVVAQAQATATEASKTAAVLGATLAA
ncbi:hypothetical protein M0638_28495, partial [Roseomonas sp. NAR14]